jgi:hypothetical protein
MRAGLSLSMTEPKFQDTSYRATRISIVTQRSRSPLYRATDASSPVDILKLRVLEQTWGHYMIGQVGAMAHHAHYGEKAEMIMNRKPLILYADDNVGLVAAGKRCWKRKDTRL